MPNSPNNRTTRSNSFSNTQNIALNDIKILIDNSKNEILTAVKGDYDSVRDEVKRFCDTITTLIEKIQRMDDRNKELESKIESLETKIQSMEQQRHFMTEEDMIHEAEDRFRRRKYLIVSGVQEQTTGTVDERREKDEEYIKDIAKEMGIDDFEPEEVFRIGIIRNSKPRLIRFKCSEIKEKYSFLRESRMLRNVPRFQGVYINPDLTAAQRKRDAELRKELKARREAGEKVKIRQGRIVTIEQNFQ